jgi:hypothetical protein
MDGRRFDTWVASLADARSSRRSLLARLAGGAFAAVLTTLGIGAFSAEDVEAKKGKHKRGRKKGAKSCAQRCNRKGRKKGKKGGGKRKKQSKRRAPPASLLPITPLRHPLGPEPRAQPDWSGRQGAVLALCASSDLRARTFASTRHLSKPAQPRQTAPLASVRTL